MELEADRAKILERYQQFKQVGPAAGIGPDSYRIACAQYELELTLLAGDIKRAELDVDDGVARDELQAQRPPGCFCFGLGGRGLCVKVGDDPETGAAVYRWMDACGCPDGLAMEIQAAAIVHQNELEENAAEEARERARAEERRKARITTSGITPRVLGYSWLSYPRYGEPEAQRAIWRLEAIAHPSIEWVVGHGMVIEPHRGVYLSGPVGTGKTTLAQLALLDWINAGKDGQFINLPKWLEALRSFMNREPNTTRPREMANTALSAPLLVVDDLGTEYLTEWGAEKVYLLINERYERKLPTIYTANYELGAMVPRLAGTSSGGHTPDMVRGQRIVDRIYETCDQLELSGESLRAEVLA